MDKVQPKPFSQVLGQAPAVGPKPFSSLIKVQEQEDPISRYESIMSRYENKPLTKEVILADKDLMGLVRENVSTRFKDRNLLSAGASAVAGGAGAYGWENMSDEELFETWQEYHRSFAGGQTVTTANVLTTPNLYSAVHPASRPRSISLMHQMVPNESACLTIKSDALANFRNRLKMSQ